MRRIFQDVKKSVRQEDIHSARQTDRKTERQNDSMTVWQNSRAAKEPALVIVINFCRLLKEYM